MDFVRQIPLGIIFGLIAIGVVILLAATSGAYTPQFRGEDGEIIEGSIAEERRMVLGGAEQYVLIRGRNRNAPLLIFLHGGPGYSAMPFNRLRNAALEEDFVFVNWDQRGAGKSFSAASDPSTLNLDQLTRDLDDLVDALRAEFDHEKVLLVGHSWGSLLGLDYASRHPEKVAAYIGVSQFSNALASERESYEWSLAQAQKQNDAKALANLEKIGPPPYEAVDEMWTQRRALNKMGGVWFEPKPDSYYAQQYLRCAEFAWPGLINLVRGGQLSTERLFSTAFSANAFIDYPKLVLPVFFIEGRHDHVTSPRLAEIYLNALDAPQKQLIWFERSGHMPNWEEPEKFNEEVRRIAAEVGLLH